MWSIKVYLRLLEATVVFVVVDLFLFLMFMLTISMGGVFLTHPFQILFRIFKRVHIQFLKLVVEPKLRT